MSRYQPGQKIDLAASLNTELALTERFGQDIFQPKQTIEHQFLPRCFQGRADPEFLQKS
jgi:hypothetical protein